MSLQPNFEVLWIEQVLKNQVKPMLPSTLSTSLPSKDTKKASETAYSQIRCQRCFIFSLLNSPQPLISRGFPSFPTSSRMVSRQNVLFVIYSVKLQPIRIPHTGRHATGSISDLPSFCKYFIISTFPPLFDFSIKFLWSYCNHFFGICIVTILSILWTI